MRRVELDTGGHHAIELAWDARGGQARLIHDAGDRRSPLHEALALHLRVDQGALKHRFDGSDAITWSGGGSFVLRLGTLVLFELDLARDALVGEAYLLSPIECRFLADNGVPHPGRASVARDASPTTDLHTHFAACVRGDDLVRMAVEHGVAYPRALLAELGVRCEGTELDIALDTLAPELIERIGRRLIVPHDRQITFLEMERLYRLRAPLTKQPRLLLPQLDRIARDYAAAGVTYAELSFSDVVRGDVLRAIHREVPAIEARHGVTLRFLAAISRHDDLEWDLDVIDRLEVVAKSKYVAGVDVMGHETNPTRAFERQLREIAARLPRVRPRFVVRVHAGESPAHPANVREAIELTRGHDVSLRIGHGLYGVDARTIEMLRAHDVLVEFNLTSNFSLNNVQSLADVPLVRYAEEGVPLVLGSDGPGLYGTDARLEARAARMAGLDDAALAAILRTEARYVEERRALDALASDRELDGDLVHRHHGPAVRERKEAARTRRDERLREAIEAAGARLVTEHELDAMLAGRRCVSIAGSWRKAWAATPERERARVVSELASLIEALPREVVLVTGGTRFGVEHEVQRLAAARGVDVLGAIVSESPPDDLSPDVRAMTIVAETLYAKSAGLYELVRRYDGACVFVGGGPIVNDEIQAALNLRLEVLLMDGPDGASTRHAREQPARAFRDAREALERLARARTRIAPFWYRGPNPTADVVLLRRDGERVRLLAIRRDLDAPCEAGRWALPGGFVRTEAARGEVWRAGVESALGAALRELREESALDLSHHAELFEVAGTYEGEGRDPRDRPTAWSRSTVFVGWLPDALRAAPLAGGDDACDARWMELAEIDALAFDHPRIVRDVLARFGVSSRARTP